MVTVRAGWAVQSIGYKTYLPIGDPVTLVRTLGRWGLDEVILMSIDRSALNLGPDLDLLQAVGRCVTGVPLTYAGGVQSKSQAIDVIKAGADRVGIDNLLRSDHAEVMRISESLGLQAVVGIFPLLRTPQGNGSVEILNYLKGTKTSLAEELTLPSLRGSFSEALVVDVMHEGKMTGFDIDLLAEFKIHNIPTLVLGGISTTSQISKVMQDVGVQGACIENFLFYRENSPYYLRSGVPGLRNPRSSSAWQFDAVL